MNFRIVCILFAVTFTFFSSGCAGRRELHDKLLVEGIGIDVDGNEYKATIHIFDADFAEGEGEGRVEVVETKGNSVMEALTNMTSQTGEEPLYSQNSVLLVGENAAKQGMNNILDFFVRHYEARPYVCIFIVKGSAADAMKAKSGGKPIMSQTINELAKTDTFSANDIGSNVMKFTGDLKNQTADPKALALKVEKKGEDSTLSIDGMAIFCKDKLAGFLNLDETIGLFLLRHKLVSRACTVEVPGLGKVSFTIYSSKSKVNIDIQNGEPVFNIDVTVKANTYEINCDSPKRLASNFSELLEQHLEQNLKETAEKTINKVIREYKSDVLYMGQRLMKDHTSYFKSNETHIKEIISNAKYNVSISAKIEKIGQETDFS